MTQPFEYSFLPFRFDQEDPVSPLEFHGKLSKKNEWQITKSPPRPIALGRDRDRALFRFHNYADGWWLYAREGAGDPDLVVIRQACTMTLNISVRNQVNGKTRVAATTLAGNTVWAEQYGMNELCRMSDVKSQVRTALLSNGKIGPVTPIKFMRGSKLLSGRHILKSGAKMEPWRRFCHNRRHRQCIRFVPCIRKYMVKKAMHVRRLACSGVESQAIPTSYDTAQRATRRAIASCSCKSKSRLNVSHRGKHSACVWARIYICGGPAFYAQAGE